jgi:ankyrin repeat protein
MGVSTSREEDASTLLWDASKKGDLPRVEHLLDNGGNVHMSRDGRTLLLLACEGGHLKVAECLVRKGAYLNAKDKERRTPLHYACEKGHLEVVKFLVSGWASPNAKDNEGRTPLHVSCEKGHLKIVKFLVWKGANPNLKDNKGRTSLHVSCEKGHLEVVKFLIEKGMAYLKAKDNEGMTPLHYASRENHSEVFKYISFELREKYIENWLCTACEEGRLEEVMHLLSQGANMEARRYGQYTPLQVACLYEHYPVVKYLVKKGANIEARTDQLTPLYLANLNGNTDIVRFLISQGADTRIEKYDMDPEMFAWLEKVRMMEALMSAMVERVGAGSPLALLKYKDLFKHLRSFLYK